jgi:hypothetical protein
MAIDVIRSKIVVADLSYVKPVFTADYLQIRVLAEVTMPDVLDVEIITPTDLVSLEPQKGVVDSITGFTDTQLFNTVKGISDIATLTEALTVILILIREFSDTLSVPETSFLVDVSKVLTENPLISDTLALDNAKLLIDNGLISDLETKDFSKLITSYGQYYAERDYFLEDYTADTIDGDLVYADDEFTSLLVFGRIVDDTISAVEGGGLYVNTYCEASYFLEDYAGESRTFT